MSDTPMTREQAWENVTEALKCLPDTVLGWQDKPQALASLAFLRTEMERLEGERADIEGAWHYQRSLVDEGRARTDTEGPE